MQRVFLTLGLGLALASSLAAQLPPGLSTKTLDNGLEVFVFQNSNVPLTRVEIAFRCGAITQTADTAGLFHLYEHMLFKGNDAFANEAAFNAAMTELGVSGWNGGTSAEEVNYYVTVPSSKTQKGIEFWSHAILNPTLDPKELENEKNVVLNEVRGYYADPSRVFDAAFTKRVFASAPWRRDVSGTEAVLKGATVAQLRAIQKTWYIPNNAALIVSGDVDPTQVFAWAQESFGGWARGDDPWVTRPAAHPVPQAGRFWYAHSSQYPGFGYADLRLRGPDVLADDASTYAADVWLGLLDRPDGRFKKAMAAALPSLYNPDYLNVGYGTQRDGGVIDFTTYLVGAAPGGSLMAKAAAFEKAVRDQVAQMVSDPTYFTDEEFEAVKQRLRDSKVYERETAPGFTSSLSFWWASASTAYYLGYDAQFSLITRDDLTRFLQKYVTQPGVLGLFISPREAQEAAGWDKVTDENALWWKGRK